MWRHNVINTAPGTFVVSVSIATTVNIHDARNHTSCRQAWHWHLQYALQERNTVSHF